MMSRYLILGLPKSGTTVLFDMIKNSLPGRYTTIVDRYDAHTFEQLPETVLAKIPINPKILATFETWENFQEKVLHQFDKIIFLARDPRDRLISSLLSIPQQEYHQDQYTAEQIQKIVEKLREKEIHPSAVGVHDIQDFYSDLKIPSYVPEPKNPPPPRPTPVPTPKRPTTDPYLLSLELHDAFPNLHVCTYEELIDQNYKSLESYLGLDLILPQAQEKSQTKYQINNWKSWFTDDDVKHFRKHPSFSAYMKRYKYEDWELDASPRIPPSTSSELVLKNFQALRLSKAPKVACTQPAFIISGFERSGTTLVSEIFRQHPKLDSGFEVGALLFDSPKAFWKIKPEEYYINLIRGWKIEEAQLKHVCNTYSWDEFYRRLKEASPLVKDKSSHIFDKTPKYMLYLNKILSTHPRMKAIVTTKHPVRLFFSWARRGVQFRDPYLPEISFEAYLCERIDTYANHFNHYFEGLNSAYQMFGPARVLPIPYEKLCRNTEGISRKMFDFTGYSFDPSYLIFDQQFANVHQNQVNAMYLDEYLEHLSPKTIQKIMALTHDALKYCPPEFFAH